MRKSTAAQAMQLRCNTLVDSLQAQKDAAQRLVIERQQELWPGSLHHSLH